MSFMEVPEDAICPITKATMEDPVICADGHSYEREAIEAWFARGHRTSPKTNCELLSITVVPNHSLRNLIRALNVLMPQAEQAALAKKAEPSTALPQPEQPWAPPALSATSAPDVLAALAEASSAGGEREEAANPRLRRLSEWEEFLEKGEQQEPGAAVFVVDMLWFEAWTSWARKGGLPPGPVKNECLLDGEGRPVPGLRQGKHWTFMREAQWSFLQFRHGGGPALQRCSGDLYGA